MSFSSLKYIWVTYFHDYSLSLNKLYIYYIVNVYYVSLNYSNYRVALYVVLNLVTNALVIYYVS